MSSKEFDLLMGLIITMLEKGQVEEVVELLKEVRNKEVPEAKKN